MNILRSDSAELAMLDDYALEIGLKHVAFRFPDREPESRQSVG